MDSTACGCKMGHEEICEFLINNLEDKNPSCTNGMTPFHYAAEGGLTNVCRLIFENIGDKNPAALNGCTPLHLAAKNGHLQIARLIVNTGVDKNSLFHGKTPLDLHLVYRSHFRSFTYYKLLSKGKFQLCDLIFEDLWCCFIIFFFMFVILFSVMMLISTIIGSCEIDFPDKGDHFSEFLRNIMPIGALIIFVIALLLTIIIQSSGILYRIK